MAELLIGKHFQAGNLGGHFVVKHNGALCTCGNIGCMEAEASTWRLPTLLKEHPGFNQSAIRNEEVLDFRALFHYAGNNDRVAREVLDYCLSAWAAGIITMIHAFDPEMIILSGGIMNSSADYSALASGKSEPTSLDTLGKSKAGESQIPRFSRVIRGRLSGTIIFVINFNK